MSSKVLILTNSSYGLHLFRQELLSELHKSREVVVATPFDGKTAELEELGCRLFDVKMKRRGINPLKDHKLLKTYVRLIRKERPEMVITYTIKPNVYGGMACRLLKVPYAANVTGLGTAFEKKGLLKSFVIWMYRHTLKKSKVVFFENSSDREVFLRERILPEKKTVVLSGAGVNLERFAYAPYPVNEKFRFLFIGRIMKEKGIDELLEAMQKLREKNVSCELDVVGSKEEDYQDRLEKREAQGWLTYHGIQNDVRPFLRNCDCFVLASYHEGMANVNLEAASIGRPIITSNVPGCKEAVIDGVSGLLCEARNVSSLLEQMNRMVSMPLDQRIQMGRAGREHMKEVFDKKKVIEQTMKAILG